MAETPGGLGNYSVNNEDEESDEEKRQIRQNYHSLIDELNRSREELIDPSSDFLDEQLIKVEKYYETVLQSNRVRTRETALDSHALNLISNLGKLKAQALNTEFVCFEPSEFAEKLKARVGPEHLESWDGEHFGISKSGWASIGRECAGLFRRSAPLTLLYGSFDPGTVQVHKSIRRNHAKENTTEKATVPKQISSFGETEKNEATTEEVERVLACLRELYKAEGQTPICYFRFILNPDSFGRTVENMFHLAFLVRDGLARIFLDEDKLPVVAPVNEEESQALKTENVRSQQTVISLSPTEWRELLETFGVRHATIPFGPLPPPTSNDSEMLSPSSGVQYQLKRKSLDPSNYKNSR